MAFETGFYSTLQGPDIMGNVQQGLKVRAGLDERAKLKKADDDKLAYENAMKANTVTNPDGTTSVNQGGFMKALTDLGQGSQAQAYGKEQVGNQLQQQQLEWQKGAQDRWATEQKNSLQARRDAIQMRSMDRKDSRDQRAYDMSVKQEEKMQGLATPYGSANTIDDAKQLKEAHESKANFDNKIGEMIALRKEFGGEMMNRDAVGRGKQLSKDLLLEYKNMAKLGVLSKSDEDIINAIIPADPLEYRSPLAAIQGQDPVMTRLTKFKSDSDKDFANRVQTRTRSGIAQAQQSLKAPKDPYDNMSDAELALMLRDPKAPSYAKSR